jgi:hypothetical protein
MVLLLSRVQTFSSEVSHLFPVCVLKGPPFVFSNEVCLCSSLRVGLSSNNLSYKYSNLFVDQRRSWDDGQLTVQFVISPIRNRSAYLDAILNRLRRKRKVTRQPRCELLLRYQNSACDVYIYIYIYIYIWYTDFVSLLVLCSVDGC